MPNNFTVVDEYVDSKIAQCAMEDSSGRSSRCCKRPHSYALGSLQSQVAMMLSRLEVYHPEAYITAVEEFAVKETN